MIWPGSGPGKCRKLTAPKREKKQDLPPQEIEQAGTGSRQLQQQRSRKEEAGDDDDDGVKKKSIDDNNTTLKTALTNNSEGP